MKAKYLYPLTILGVFCSFTSCIKDTDFSNLDEVKLTPKIELDLIYFTLNANEFFDPDTSAEILVVRDTTDIRFLNDAEAKKSLKGAEFYFEFTNSVPRQFNVEFQFLDDSNQTTYLAQTLVNQGEFNKPAKTIFIEEVGEQDISKITQASKFVTVVTIPSSDANLEGSLNMKSKVTYFLEL